MKWAMTPDALSGVLTVTVRVKDFPLGVDFLAGTTGTTGLGFLLETNTATGLGTDTVFVEVDTLLVCDLVFFALPATDFFSDPLLIVTLPVASNLRSAGVKWEMVDECLSGVLILTVRDKSRSRVLLTTLVTGFILDENVREEDWVFVVTFFADEPPDLFIVTLPVASNL